MIILFLLFVLFLSNTLAQDATQFSLPDGAKARFGKGTLGEIAYFPDGTRFAVATSIGIWVYDSLTGKEIYKLTDHTNGVEIVRFSRDGNTIATKGPHGSVQLLNTQLGNHQLTLTDDEIGYYNGVFSPNGKIIVVQCAEKYSYLRKTLRVYNVQTGEHLSTISEPSNRFHNIRFSADSKTLATWGYRQLKLWDVTTGQHLKTINDPCEGYHDNQINDVQFSPDGKTIFILSRVYITRNSRGSSWTGNVGIVNFRSVGAEEWKQLERTRQSLDDEGFSSIFFSPDGKLLVTIDKSDGKVDLWDANTGEYINSLMGNDSSKINTVSFSENGRIIATGGRDGTIHLWATKDGVHLIPFSGHKGSINNIVFSPDGITILSEGSDNTVHLWDAMTGKLLKTINEYTEGISNVSFTPDGKTIASWSYDETMRLWDASTGHLLKQYKLNGLKGSVNSFQFSPNGNTFTATCTWGMACLWGVATGKLLNTFSRHRHDIVQMDYSPDGNTIVSRSSDNSARLWNGNTGQLLSTLTGIKGKLYEVDFSSDSAKLVTQSSENAVQVWDANTGQFLNTLTGITGNVDGAYFSPNVNTIITNIYEEDRDDGVYLWDGKTGQHIEKLNGYSGATSLGSYSPDGKIMAIVNGHGSGVSLFDISKRQHLNTLTGHVSLPFCGGGTISDVRFSCNGQTIVTASGVDGTAIIWNSSTGERLKTLIGHTDGVSSVAFSPDSKTLASGSNDGTILLWDVPQ